MKKIVNKGLKEKIIYYLPLLGIETIKNLFNDYSIFIINELIYINFLFL